MKPLITRLDDGTFRIPALVDAHVHVESSHLIPSRFGELIAAQGTLAAVCDPHEIVNVLGEDGLEFMLEDARHSPARLRFALPSCVPATPFETSGASLSAADTAHLFTRHPELIALGEMMNVPGVLADDPEVRGKITAALAIGKRVDGHFPGGRGAALAAYAAAGISSDHESLDADEARGKIAAGLTVFIREGSAAKNLETILPAVNDDNWERFCFCTDDISARDLGSGGGIIACVRKAVRLGMDPERAVALATINPARHYGFTIPDGDYLVVRDLTNFEILQIFKNGHPFVRGKNAAVTIKPRNTVRLPDLTDRTFAAPPPHADKLDVIGIRDGSLITDHLHLDPGETADLTLLTVIERHGRNGNIASAWTLGSGLRTGAIASTVAHDHHNLIVLGNDPSDIRLAARHLAETGGGLCVVRDGTVLADLPLPIAGLMSAKDGPAISSGLLRIRETARKIGCTLTDPFATLSFLALPVIPSLKLTDKGLIEC